MSSLLLILSIIIISLVTLNNAFDITRLKPIADRNIRTGNRVLYERPLAIHTTSNVTVHGNNNDNDNDNDDEEVVDQMGKNNGDDFLDVNEIPVRFDEMQLWRIYNISENMRKNALPIADLMEDKFGGVIWKENSKFLDISIGREHLKGARSFLVANNLEREVLNTNVQDLIDSEEMEGIAASMAKPGARTKKATRSTMNWQEYHDIDVIYSFMREIREKFPNICRLYTIGKSVEGRDLKVLRISENPKEFKKIWIDGGIHAREWISPATVTFILYQLMSKWTEQPAYIRQKTWYFMPVMNPDGYMYSRKTNRLWRKNRAISKRSQCVGVDLNRNFDIGWSGFGSSTNPCKDTYRGTQPASEPETKAVVEFLGKRKHNLEAYLTYHSYGQVMTYPWAYKSAKVPDSGDLLRVGKTAMQRIKDKTGTVYRTGATYELLGIAGGGSDDWSRAALGTKYVYTVELRDRGNHGFVLPPAQIKGCGQEGYEIATTVAQAI